MVEKGNHVGEEAFLGEVHFVFFIRSCPVIVEPMDPYFL